MKIPSTVPRLQGYRFPRSIVAYAVWAYHRFALSTGDVEDLLAERGVTVSRETVRQWINRFGCAAAAALLALALMAALAKTSTKFSDAVVKSINPSARTVTLADGNTYGPNYAGLVGQL